MPKDMMAKLQGWVDFNAEIPPYTFLAQGRAELKQFFSVLETINPRNICLEIGIWHGGTFYLWKQFFDNVIGIDYDRSLCDSAKTRLGEYGCDPTTSCFICGDSQEETTLVETRAWLDGRRIDFLFIDGPHTYEALKSDFESYLPLVRIGGLIAIHDVGEREHAHMPGGKPTPPPLTPTFENLHRYAMEIDADSERYGITKLQFIHIDHGGIGWCVKVK